MRMRLNTRVLRNCYSEGQSRRPRWCANVRSVCVGGGKRNVNWVMEGGHLKEKDQFEYL